MTRDSQHTYKIILLSPGGSSEMPLSLVSRGRALEEYDARRAAVDDVYASFLLVYIAPSFGAEREWLPVRVHLESPDGRWCVDMDVESMRVRAER